MKKRDARLPRRRSRSTNKKYTIPTMATKAVVGRGLREAGAALKHASGMEVCVIISFLFV